MSGCEINWQRVKKGEAQMILGGARPILSLTFEDVREASGDQALSDEFCAEVLNHYAEKNEIPWAADLADLVKLEKEERAR